jgi:hypothetical protein
LRPESNHIVLGIELDRKIDEALEVLRNISPRLNWSREKLIRVAIDRGLNQLFRQHNRKNASLRGVYLKTTEENATDNEMIVENLSVGGIGFRTRGPHFVRESEILHVAFILADVNRTVVTRRVMVRHVHDRYVGAEFCEPDDYNSVGALDHFLAG